MIKTILDEITAVSGKIDKRKTLSKYSDNELLKRVIYLAHSPRVKFYVKQIPNYTAKGTPTTLESALDRLDELSSRTVTGHAAISVLVEILESVVPEDAYVIEKIIGKNLRIGMDTGYNDVIPGLIEETPYMGAKSYSEKLVKKLFNSGDGVRSDIKADGTYRNAVIRSGEVEIVSRKGEVSVLEGTPFLNDLSTLEDCVLNGELTIDGQPDRSIANGMVSSIMDILQKAEERGEKITSKKKEVFEKKHGSFEDAIQNLRYTVWDIITIDEYFNKKSSTIYETRRTKLENIFETNSFNKLSLIESKIVTSQKEAMEHFQDALSRGLEGTIVKSLGGVWKDGKPVFQVKLKLEMTMDLKIVGFQYGTVGTKNENVISTLLLESSCGLLKTNPSGMKEDMMDYVTANQEKLLGTVVEIRCCGLSETDKGWSCMHPSIVELRTDKDTLDSLESAIEIENMAKGLS